jgi:hypothetical protein
MHLHPLGGYRLGRRSWQCEWMATKRVERDEIPSPPFRWSSFVSKEAAAAVRGTGQANVNVGLVSVHGDGEREGGDAISTLSMVVVQVEGGGGGIRGTSQPNIDVGLVCARADGEGDRGEGGDAFSTLSVVVVRLEGVATRSGASNQPNINVGLVCAGVDVKGKGGEG